MATFTYLNTTPTGTFSDSTVSRSIDVSGLTYGQLITGVSITMIGLTHSWLDDFDILLMAPGGENLMVMSDVMGSLNSAYSDVTFSDAGSTILPSNSGFGLDLESGTYRPFAPETTETLATFGLPDGPINHATGDGVVSFATAFNGTNPNGQWTLYLEDNFSSDSGSMAAWSLTIQTNGPFAELTGTAGDDTITVTSTSATDGSYLISGSTPVGYTGVSGFDMIGLAGNDVLRGGDGNENIFGGAGRDMMYGGGGTDWFFVGDGELVAGEVYDGGAGDDRLVLDLSIPAAQTQDLRQVTLRSIEQVDWSYGSGSGQLTVQMLASQIGNGNIASNATFTGRVGAADRLEFTMASSNTLSLAGLTFIGFDDANDRIIINGDTSDETITGSGFFDSIVGGGGSDMLFGGAGNDLLYGVGGNDHIWGGDGADVMDGGSGTDYARYDDANYGNLMIRLDNSTLNTGAAAVGDTYAGIEGLVGGLGNDTVFGNITDNFLFGGGGTDLIYGGIGNDYLSGDAGADNLWGGEGADAHVGGNDAGIDYARYDDANYGNLTLRLDNATFNAGAAAVGDTYTGIEGLVGGAGADVIIGNASANYLFGQGGADYIDGQGGSDYLNGGADADRFRFSTALGAGNIDTIADFQHGVDDILLAQAIFAAIGASLTADEFRIGSAQDANDFILYDNITGQLYYDSNGNGAGGIVQFATVTAGTVLTFDDFIMA